MTVNALSHEAALRSGDAVDAGTLALEAQRLRENLLNPDEELAFALTLRREAAHQPSVELAQLISSLLSEPSMDVTSERGGRLRAQLVQAQLALGFPWALEIAPEDIGLAHATRREFVGARVGLGLVGTLSLLWNGMFAYGTSEATGHSDRLLPFYFAVGALHAAASVFASLKVRSQVLYRSLGLMVLCGPLFAVVQTFLAPPVDASIQLVAGLIAGLPAMVTALVALGIAGSMPRE